MTLGQIRIEPHFYLTIFVHADQILRNVEITYSTIKLLETIQCTVEHIQIFRKRNILNIAEAYGNMFYIDPRTMICLTKLFCLLVVKKFRAYYIILTLSPFQELKVFLKLGLAVKKEMVFLYVLTGKVVAEESEDALIRACLGPQIRDFMPVFLIKGERLIWFWLFIAHSKLL